ncbi:putative quinol monooxygenase [Shewanella frigidimarina]|jgi:quinol monooxygenase YgiN|uniref:Antibiotic biosynthesis monooxygenase n=2 Tax=Shewanella frigidimarina TaxID=56812 RepID=Q088F2_SHEFN|nr:putative quinol monooxygenase [Shewanella frigidimarina]ABI70363.1 Antibiotic biosynthesis monooxygenase [Shewanella frigidimarina NCIMB 400]KVX00205.1 antibiotic biosynthesis monooxygenase [Shewanella frigidimarina]MBB1383323.1 antibiotic biosynthesis monooxygenase [Shewanella sp. SR41-2]HBF46315.1 antibiotic biosynthesis monooxygenase [Shewanella frigidimarina]|tara:strand:+ start:987 stop:1304 length:318 start_codon:yes stop_codon:yes gene_type:complete
MSDYVINTQQIVCVAQFVAKAGKRDELVAVLASLIPDTRRESGCIRYELNISVDNDNKVAFVEKFVDRAAFDQHCAKDAIQHYFHNVMPELVESHHVEVFNQVIA